MKALIISYRKDPIIFDKNYISGRIGGPFDYEKVEFGERQDHDTLRMVFDGSSPPFSFLMVFAEAGMSIKRKEASAEMHNLSDVLGLIKGVRHGYFLGETGKDLPIMLFISRDNLRHLSLEDDVKGMRGLKVVEIAYPPNYKVADEIRQFIKVDDIGIGYVI